MEELEGVAWQEIFNNTWMESHGLCERIFRIIFRIFEEKWKKFYGKKIFIRNNFVLDKIVGFFSEITLIEKSRGQIVEYCRLILCERQ